ncbi:MAG: phosphoglycolate phosphatase [Hyphomicrobiaceae bacterium]
MLNDLTVVFDLDGTLVETAPDLIRAVNHILESQGLAAVEPALIRPSISFGGRAMIQRALDLHGVTASPTEVDALFDMFIAHYSANISVDSHPFPGLIAALDVLQSRGARLAVCTNKREVHSRDLLEQLGLASLFAAIAGRDTFEVHKPHPEHLLGVIRLANGNPARGIMIGDSETDIRTARAAGLPVIAVPFGYTDTPVDQLGPDAVISHYDELVPTIDRLIAPVAK